MDSTQNQHWILLKIITELNQSISSGATKRKDRDEKDNDDVRFQILQSFARPSAPYDCQCEPMNTQPNQCERNIR